MKDAAGASVVRGKGFLRSWLTVSRQRPMFHTYLSKEGRAVS